MDSHNLIDAQFLRAVQIVQSLPKNGPVQTDYVEKLTMYSLYKQATVGNVKSPRPGIWDMLGRAKWDAWAKHKDLDSFEAKWRYVETLLKVLRKYSDKTIARDLVQELEAFGGDPSNLVMSRTKSKSANSSSGSSSSRRNRVTNSYPNRVVVPTHEEEENSDSGDDEARELPPSTLPLGQRPQSSLSSDRYRTPMTGSLAISPPTVPETQPLATFETVSAFAEPSNRPSPYPPSASYTGNYSEISRSGLISPQMHGAHLLYRGQSQPSSVKPYNIIRPPSRLALERAIESVQSHLAALTERIESLEVLPAHRSNVSLPRSRGSPPRNGLGYHNSETGDGSRWDLDDLGMWSYVVHPVFSGASTLLSFAKFFASNENRSPTMLVVRRLCLDVSFLLCVLASVRALWRRSGVRRKEVYVALLVLWRAILGAKKERTMVDRGV